MSLPSPRRSSTSRSMAGTPTLLRTALTRSAAKRSHSLTAPSSSANVTLDSSAASSDTGGSGGGISRREKRRRQKAILQYREFEQRNSPRTVLGNLANAATAAPASGDGEDSSLGGLEVVSPSYMTAKATAGPATPATATAQKQASSGMLQTVKGANRERRASTIIRTATAGFTRRAEGRENEPPSINSTDSISDAAATPDFEKVRGARRTAGEKRASKSNRVASKAASGVQESAAPASWADSSDSVGGGHSELTPDFEVVRGTRAAARGRKFARIARTFSVGSAKPSDVGENEHASLNSTNSVEAGQATPDFDNVRGTRVANRPRDASRVSRSSARLSKDGASEPLLADTADSVDQGDDATPDFDNARRTRKANRDRTREIRTALAAQPAVSDSREDDEDDSVGRGQQVTPNFENGDRPGVGAVTRGAGRRGRRDTEDHRRNLAAIRPSQETTTDNEDHLDQTRASATSRRVALLPSQQTPALSEKSAVAGGSARGLRQKMTSTPAANDTTGGLSRYFAADGASITSARERTANDTTTSTRGSSRKKKTSTPDATGGAGGLSNYFGSLGEATPTLHGGRLHRGAPMARRRLTQERQGQFADIQAADSAHLETTPSTSRNSNAINRSVRFEEQELPGCVSAQTPVRVGDQPDFSERDEFQTPSIVAGGDRAAASGAETQAEGQAREGLQSAFLHLLQERDDNLGSFVRRVLSPVERRMGGQERRDADGFKRPKTPPKKAGKRRRRDAGEEQEGPAFGAKHIRWEIERELRTEAKLTNAAMPALMEVSERFAQKTQKYLKKKLDEQGRSGECLSDLRELMMDFGLVEDMDIEGIEGNDEGGAGDPTLIKFFMDVAEALPDPKESRLLLPEARWSGGGGGQTLARELWTAIPEEQNGRKRRRPRRN